LLFVDIIFFHLLRRRLFGEQPRPSPVLCHKLAKAAEVRSTRRKASAFSVRKYGIHAIDPVAR
jgi:hypothetical protein